MEKNGNNFIIKISSNEACKLSSYLINKKIGTDLETRYENAIQIKKVLMNSSEQKLWNLMLKNSLILVSVDSFLALTNRYSPIRQRICIMLAILEAHPDYFSSFYNKKLSYFDHFRMLFLLMTSPFKILIGILIVNLY